MRFIQSSSKWIPSISTRRPNRPLRLGIECRGAQPWRPPSSSTNRNTQKSTSSKPGRRSQDNIITNERISHPLVRLLSNEKEMLGVFSLEDALGLASQKNVDLVLQNESTDPPLCMLVDVGKYKYEQEKKQKASRQKQRAARIQQKELKMRPGTEVHDYNVRLRKAVSELGRGNHVKVIVHYRGREIQNQAEGENIVNRFVEDLGDLAIIEKAAKLEGRNLTITLAPNKK